MTATAATPTLDHPADATPSLPAYKRTGATHTGIQPFEARQRLNTFLSHLQTTDPEAYLQLSTLMISQGDPSDNRSTLTHDQAMIIAKATRRFDREGDVAARDSAELALNAAGLLLEDVLPPTPAQQVQADREGRRMAELRRLLSTQCSDQDTLPF